MTRRLIVAALMSGVLAFSVTVADASVTHHSCGSINGEYLHIHVTNTTCKVARKLIAAKRKGGTIPGWKCKGKINGQSTLAVTCKHRGSEVISFTYSFFAQA